MQTNDSGTMADAQTMSGSMMVDGACDQTLTLTNGTGTTILHYANIPISGLDLTTAPHVSAYVCNPVAATGVATDVATSLCGTMNNTCTGFTPPPPPNCVEAPVNDAGLMNNFLRPFAATVTADHIVVTCGASGTTATSANLSYQHAYVRVN